MRVVRVLNGSDADLANHRNIFIGISLGNKYFSADNIEKYVRWALEHAKERVAVLIADDIHAINLEARLRKTADKALARARKEGAKTEKMVSEIISRLAKDEQNRVVILHWKDIIAQLVGRQVSLKEAFKFDEEFRDAVMDLTKEAVPAKDRAYDEEEYERLSDYILEELPLLMNGFEHGGFVFDCFPYPGLSGIDFLTLDLEDGAFSGIIGETFSVEALYYY